MEGKRVSRLRKVCSLTDQENDPDKVLKWKILVFQKNYGEVSGAFTRQRLLARVAKYIAIQQSMGYNPILKAPEEYIELNIDFLNLEVKEYLQRKQKQGSYVSLAQSSLVPIASEPLVLSLVNKVFTLLQVPQQLEETPQVFVARQATLDYQQYIASGMIVPNNTISTKENEMVVSAASLGTQAKGPAMRYKESFRSNIPEI